MEVDDVKKLKALMPMMYTHPLWVEAFKEYNADHPDNRPLGLNCRPCYVKVRQYIITKYAQSK